MLSSCQKHFALALARAYRTAPTVALFVLSGSNTTQTTIRISKWHSFQTTQNSAPPQHNATTYILCQENQRMEQPRSRNNRTTNISKPKRHNHIHRWLEIGIRSYEFGIRSLQKTNKKYRLGQRF